MVLPGPVLVVGRVRMINTAVSGVFVPVLAGERPTGMDRGARERLVVNVTIAQIARDRLNRPPEEEDGQGQSSKAASNRHTTRAHLWRIVVVLAPGKSGSRIPEGCRRQNLSRS